MLHDFFVGSCPSPLPLEQSWGMLDEALGGASASSSPATKWLGAWWYVVFCFPLSGTNLGEEFSFCVAPAPPYPWIKVEGDACWCLSLSSGSPRSFQLWIGERGPRKRTLAQLSLNLFHQQYRRISTCVYIHTPCPVPHAPIPFGPSCPHCICPSLMPPLYTPVPHAPNCDDFFQKMFRETCSHTIRIVFVLKRNRSKCSNTTNMSCLEKLFEKNVFSWKKCLFSKHFSKTTLSTCKKWYVPKNLFMQALSLTQK